MDSGTLTALAAGAGSDDPIMALGAIRRLRRELDQAETLAVRRAKNAGASWQLIAIALGVSRQAVQQKYGRA
jgi:DNA invertase Pin-like site-specific DNA recombinase